MKTALVIALVPILMGCSRQSERWPVSDSSANRAPGQSVESEQIVPTQDESRPQPALAPEDRERLLQGTKIIDPNALKDPPPSPPGLPSEAVPETGVSP